jgi:exodeoxyribonuclease VII small subunit
MASFEEQLAELEKVVEQLERGDLALEDSVALFERGMQLSGGCKAQLASAESRIQVLLNPQERGAVRTEEFVLEVDAESDALEEAESLEDEEDGEEDL